MKNQIKTWKTARTNRKTYSYEQSLGQDQILFPGKIDISTGYVVTAEDIKCLHSMDDAETYNNAKNIIPKFQAWQKSGIEAWIAEHPGERPPKNAVVSLDDMLADQNGSDYDQDKGGAIGRASLQAYQAEIYGNPMVERMREIVMEMGEEYWKLYVWHTIKGYTFEEIGLAIGKGTSTVGDRFKKITETIKSKLYVK